MLRDYGIHVPFSCQGASDGIENSTYFLRAGEREWVLTLFEALSSQELPFFISLMTELHAHKLPVAYPLADQQGKTLHCLSGKPALLFPRLTGAHVMNVHAAHCAAIGAFLGEMHTRTANYPEARINPHGTQWMQTSQQHLPNLLDDEKNLLTEQINNAVFVRAQGLPQGIIHGDLFRDNALFVGGGEQLAGVIDFYHAGTDVLLLDLAIAINDWCALANGSVDEVLAQTMVSAYCAQRHVTAHEQQHWPTLLQLAAARFWLSRLWVERTKTRQTLKPSAEYLLRLRYHREHKMPVRWG